MNTKTGVSKRTPRTQSVWRIMPAEQKLRDSDTKNLRGEDEDYEDQRTVSQTRWESSGRMSLVMASSTALGEPGMEKTTMWRGSAPVVAGVTMMPAVARERSAPLPMDW